MAQQLFTIDPAGSNSGNEVRGPATLGRIVDGDCEQVLDVFFAGEAGFIAGVWRCTPGTMELTDYPFDEMAVVIEGRIEVTDADTGETKAFGPGEALAISRGFRGTWHMPEAVLKRFAAHLPQG